MSEEIYITVAKELLDELKKLVESAEQEEKNTIEVNQEQGDTSSESIKQWYDFNKIKREICCDKYIAEKVKFIYDKDDYYFIPGLIRTWKIGFLTSVFFNIEVLLKYIHHPLYGLDIGADTFGYIYIKGILDIFKGEETPYYYSGDGVLEAYVRVGNESVKATSTELKRLVLRGRNTSYDSQISTYKVEDFAFSKLRERYKKWTGNSFDEKDLISFGLANEQGYLTNAGALVADESPIRWSRLFCTRWNGLNKSGVTIDAFDDAEYSGSVLSLIDNGEAFIKRNAKLMWRKTANSREEMPEYVERSYHEALVNALAHRDYLVNGSEVHIDIYDDRMEIYSPGGMPDGSIIQDRDPLTVPSTRRNPVLADIFNRLGYMERKGSGFGKIIGGYEFQINYDESKKPSFRSDRYQFTVVMPNLNYNVPQDVPRNVPQKKESNPLEIQILNMIKKDNKISTEKMAMTLGISSKTVKRHIKDIGIVRFVGRGSNGHWEIIDD